MTVNAGDSRAALSGQCPGGSRDAGAAADVENRFRWIRGAAKNTDDSVYGQQMEGRIEQRECRSFAGAVEGSIERLATPFHIGGRECPKGASDFRHAKVAKVSRFECGQPVAKHRGVFKCHG